MTTTANIPVARFDWVAPFKSGTVLSIVQAIHEKQIRQMMLIEEGEVCSSSSSSGVQWVARYSGSWHPPNFRHPSHNLS